MCNNIVIIFLISYYNDMINYDEIKENFNGKIILNDVSYFFDVKDDVLRIFFNETGIKTVGDFNKTFFTLLKKGWISGVCEDEYRVIFGIREICMSDYPSVYAKYRLFVCIIASYIKNIVNINEKDKNANYDCIDIYYTPTKEDAKQLLDYLYKYNYNYISFTPSLFNSHEIDSFISTYNTHNVIGQEFDNVVMIMGSDFEYLNNRLNSKTHPNPNFIFSKIFYQGITRARIKLAIIVLRNPSLYKQLVQIKINKGDQL